ncbi:sensor histidine kinase [Sphingorhabdus sp. SMR4y]|uniref:sensor histidine kinase n=1 Tax=Sphingorhabdus sp. SMR4y TaxID=2584094 RepID=UPI000B5C3959|nr:ATP-binding protein [Sphingorhabdus sp. SMR4y]ASK87499.1 alkaline phosphatase synthesis sensor protein PhoR [Sphingorhabdus sp. SMR4y]
MNSVSPLRLLVALAIIFGGGILASQLPQSSQQFIVFIISGMFALFTVLQDRPAPPLPDPAALERQTKRILYQGRSEAYQDIIDPITDPIMLIRNAKVAAANPAAAQVLGNHIVGEDVRIAIRHPAAADRLANPDAKHTGEPILLVGVGSTDQRWELRIHTLQDGLKLVQLSDRSSRYAAERMRTDFVANASHELRTPLAAIKGFIETLEDPKAGKDDATRARFLKIMYDEADRMQRLIEDLMSLSRIEAEKFELPSDEIDLSELVEEARDFYINSRGKKESEIQVRFPPQIPLINGDRAQLAQVLANLLSNAFKYGKKGTPVTISVAPNRSGTMLYLAISDQGDGIAPEHIPRLTERFYRVDKGRSKAIGGTGLGLAIVKHISERHGGRMEISSELGRGTTVSVLLPIANKSPAVDPPREEAG